MSGARSLAALGLTQGAVIRGGEVRLTGLAADSREVKPGHLFAALPGTNAHGAEYAAVALDRGAVAVLTDAEGAARLAGIGATLIIADNPRLALARAAARWHGAQPGVMVAVTGTNGKTSTATFTRQLWQLTGAEAVNLGTTGVHGAVTAPLSHTTPEPVSLHALLARLASEGVTHGAMEASSHGLTQFRLDGVQLAAAAFTNITRDHMDYHADFSDYLAAKLMLFGRVLPEGAAAVINLDDPFGTRFAAEAMRRGQKLLSIGHAPECSIRIISSRFEPTGQVVLFQYGTARHEARLELIGGFQAHNALTAAGLAIASGSDPARIFAALPGLGTVPGRMELAARRRSGAAVYVDYAHTPDAIETALNALRPHVQGRLIIVFGAGGDRDRGKRPLMGGAARAGADLVIVTDDNPRTEDAGAIRAEVLAGCPDASEIGDRAEAILAGVNALQPGDTLLIAGKGHETGQIIGKDIYPFNDAEQASIAVLALEGAG
jgi:UDP-N-acetylmuramoyl-L-alanyl-D-glutamate--2,6-diaminopimelate ligase